MKRVVSLLLCIVALTVCSAAAMAKGFTCIPVNAPGCIVFKVTGVDYRSDLTRVYGELKGKPHTSERIDELVMITPDGKILKAMDIDGVDFKRWFQWEDDGVIPVEIDFPAMKRVNSFVLKSSGPKGESRTEIKSGK